MKIRNYQIINLVNNGLLNTTEHEVPAADAYKAYKFRKSVRKAFDAIAEKDKELPATVGIEEGKEATQEQMKRLAELRVALYNDESELEGIAPMSWEAYHLLAKENKETKYQAPAGENEVETRTIDFFRVFEDVLDGVLFKMEE